MSTRTRAVGLSAALLLVLTGVSSVPAGAAAEMLPDLRMARLRNFSANTTPSGQRQLRFTAIIVNGGVGPFQLTGTRGSTSEAEITSVTQQIFDDAGGVRDVATPATMYFAGDGHTHWHVRNLETYELSRLDNGVKVGTGVKAGFCFADNFEYRLNMPGAPQTRFYTSCGNADHLAVDMGLSVGWGDKYGARIPDQYIDITGLTPGTYRLTAIADADDWFAESKNGNNSTCVDLQISATSVSVVRYGCR